MKRLLALLTLVVSAVLVLELGNSNKSFAQGTTNNILIGTSDPANCVNGAEMYGNTNQNPSRLKVCTATNVFSALLSSAELTPVALTDGATVTWAVAGAMADNTSLTFTTHGGSRTLNLTGLVSGGTYVLVLTQDSTGGENLTGGSGCTWKQLGGGGTTFTLTATANAVDVLSFYYDGTTCWSNLGKAYS